MAFKKKYNQYLVDFTLPDELDLQFMNLIPQQRVIVNELFVEKTLLSYSLSLDRKKLWATFLAENEVELIEIIESFPLTIYMNYEVHPLMFNELAKQGMPSISLN